MGKTMYELVDWPDIQEFMEDYDYTDRVYFDPEKNAWFVPEDMIKKHEIRSYNRKILRELEKLIDKYPDQRFGQLIANYIFPYYRQRDIFYEESQETFENIGGITYENYG